MTPGLCTREASHNLNASWLTAGDDLLVLITGGESPHLGAVAMAAPRPSLADPARTSATTSVFCFMGHKEDELARQMAQTLASRLGCRVVVAAGLHWDGLDQAGLEAVGRNAALLLEMLLERLTGAGLAPR